MRHIYKPSRVASNSEKLPSPHFHPRYSQGADILYLLPRGKVTWSNVYWWCLRKYECSFKYGARIGYGIFIICGLMRPWEHNLGESRYSHSHSRAYCSSSRKRTRHSHRYSRYRRHTRLSMQPICPRSRAGRTRPSSLFEMIPTALVGNKPNLAREQVMLNKGADNVHALA